MDIKNKFRRFTRKITESMFKVDPTIRNHPYILDADGNHHPVDLLYVEKLTNYKFNRNLCWVPQELIANKSADSFVEATVAQTIFDKRQQKNLIIYNAIDIYDMEGSVRQPPAICAKNHNQHQGLNELMKKSKLRFIHSIYADDYRQSIYSPKNNIGYLKHPSQYANEQAYYDEVCKVMLTASCYKLVLNDNNMLELLNRVSRENINNYHDYIDTQRATNTLNCTVQILSQQILRHFGIAKNDCLEDEQFKADSLNSDQNGKEIQRLLNKKGTKIVNIVLKEKLNFGGLDVAHLWQARTRRQAEKIKFELDANGQFVLKAPKLTTEQDHNLSQEGRYFTNKPKRAVTWQRRVDNGKHKLSSDRKRRV